MQLTFYLFKDNILDFQQAIKSKKLIGEEKYEKLPQHLDLPFECEAYLQKNRTSTPSWLSFISDTFSIDSAAVFNQSNSLIILLKVKDRIFALTTGYGYSALDRNLIETDFGLKIVLNEIDPQKIRAVDLRNLDLNTKQKRVLLSQNSPLYEFDFNFDEDLLKQIVGVPLDNSFGRKLAGAESLGIDSDIPLRELSKLCEALLISYEKIVYKDSFSFIDDLKLVKDSAMLELLYNNLINSFNTRSLNGIYFTIPALNDYFNVTYYSLKYKNHECKVNEIDSISIQEFMDTHNISGEDVNAISVIGYDTDGNETTINHKLLEYVIYETTINGQKYMHSYDEWVEIDNNFIEAIEKRVDSIDDVSSSNLLPPMLKTGGTLECEGTYNARVAKERSLHSFDKVLFNSKARGTIEVCDLLTDDKKFICVKKGTRSSTLSHLFNQGVVSANLLVEDPNYRDFINNRSGKILFEPNGIKNSDREDIKYIYAIASEASEKISSSLPFFSKVALCRAKSQFERLGIRLSLCKISIINV